MNRLRRVDEVRAWLNQGNIGIEEGLRNSASALRSFMDICGMRVWPMINSYLQTQPQETREDKQTIVDWINTRVVPLGVAIVSPISGEPCRIVLVSGVAESWRFQFEPIHNSADQSDCRFECDHLFNVNVAVTGPYAFDTTQAFRCVGKQMLGRSM